MASAADTLIYYNEASSYSAERPFVCYITGVEQIYATCDPAEHSRDLIVELGTHEELQERLRACFAKMMSRL
jgi:hypothetical protein